MDAITLRNTGGRVTLQNMIVEDVGDGSDATDAINTRSSRDAIHGENVNGGLTLQSVTIRRTSDHAIQGGVSLNPSGGTFEAIVSHNLFDEAMHAAGGLAQLTIGHNTGNGVSEFIVRQNEFRRPWDMALLLRAEGNQSMAVLVENNIWTEGLVGGAGTDFEGGNCGTGDPIGFCPAPFQGVQVNVRNGGSMDLTMRNEVLPQHDDVNNAEATFIADVQPQAGNVLNLYLDGNKAPDGYRLIQSAPGAFNLYREVGADTTATDILDGNGNTGGNGTVAGGDVNGDNTSPPVVTTSGTITPTDTPPVLPAIVIP